MTTKRLLLVVDAETTTVPIDDHIAVFDQFAAYPWLYMRMDDGSWLRVALDDLRRQVQLGVTA